MGGYEPSAPTTFVPGFEAYSAYFARVATALNPCPATGAVPKLSGPGWGNVNTIDASWLAMQAKAPGVRCYMRELSVHVSVGGLAYNWAWRSWGCVAQVSIACCICKL